MYKKKRIIIKTRLKRVGLPLMSKVKLEVHVRSRVNKSNLYKKKKKSNYVGTS